GLGQMASDKARAELQEQAADHPDFGLRTEIVRTYVFQRPDTATTELTLRPGEEYLLDRFENGDEDPDGEDFDARLAAYLAKHPDHRPPLEEDLNCSDRSRMMKTKTVLGVAATATILAGLPSVASAQLPTVCNEGVRSLAEAGHVWLLDHYSASDGAYFEMIG